MTPAFGLAAPRMVANGYRPVPIIPGEKRPAGPGWQHYTYRAGAHPDHYTGLLTRHTPALDIDVDDADMAAEIAALARLQLGAGLERIGRAPRVAMLYRCAEPFAKRALDFRIGGQAHKVEILADGQQVVAFALHPDTGRPYTWPGQSPLDLPAAGLPEITAASADAFLAAVADLVQARGGQVVARNASTSRDAAPIPPRGMSPADLSGLVRRCAHLAAAYDSWVRAGLALHHETGGSLEGLQLFDFFSQQAPDKYDQAAVAAKWPSFGRGHGITVAYLEQHADPVAAFEDLGPAPVRAPRFKPIPAGIFTDREPPRWHIHGVLPQAELVVLFGESGSGKTFILLDLVRAIATGAPWRGHKVRQGRVVYVCAEGVHGFSLRLRAAGDNHGTLEVIAETPHLLASQDVSDLVAAIGQADLVVFDTLAAAAAGVSENDAAEMGRLVANCKEISRATGATVVLVHHAGKDLSRGARGWSGLRAAADAELEVRRDGDVRELRVTKQKDGVDGEIFGFRLRPVILGVDQDGATISSCAVDAAGIAPVKHELRGKWQRMAAAALMTLCDQQELVTLDELVAEVLATDGDYQGGGRDQRPANIRRALREMEPLGACIREGDTFRRPPAPEMRGDAF